MQLPSRSVRIGSTTRGVIIAALFAVYAWVEPQSLTSWPVTILIAALLQVGVIGIRRFVPPGGQVAAVHIFELLADGVSVMLFALGVFGGIASFGASV